MTENEFLELYEASYRDILNNYIQLVKENSNLKYQSLFDNTVEYDAEISRKSNLLVSLLMDKNGIVEGENMTKENIEFLASDLYKKAFNIILDCNKYYQSIIDSILLEVKNRDLND